MKKRGLLSLILTICMVLSLVPMVAYAEEVVINGDPINVRTVNNSVDKSSISVDLFVIFRNKETGEEQPREGIDTITPENVTVGTFETIKTNAIEDAKTKLNEWLEIMRQANPDVQFMVVGDIVVEGDDAEFDNRTYTMKSDGDDDIIIGDEASGSTTSGSQTSSRYMQVDGDYGYTGNYTVTATVEVQAANQGPDILPAFSPNQMVTVGIGAFEDPHYVELGENDEFKNVTGTVSYIFQDGTVFTTNELKEYLARQESGKVITVDYAFSGDGEYASFTDSGTLTFTMVSGVDNVSITIDAPKKGEALAEKENAAVTGTAGGSAVETECLVVKDVQWIDTSDTVAAADTEYTGRIVLATERGVVFAGDINAITVKVNGNEVASADKSISTDENTNEFTVVYKIAKTEAEDNNKQTLYKFIDGSNGSWTNNSNGTLTFRANGDFSKFTGVKVDDTLIDAKNYTVVSGSTVVTLKADYLKTLSVGTHKLTVVYNDGECSTNFVVKTASEQTNPTEGDKTDTTSPQTGDNSNLLLWVALLFVSIAGIIGTVVYSKRKNSISD